jgi:hypothetical protein
MTTVLLPGQHGVVQHRLAEPAAVAPLTAPSRSRVAYAAAHVVADPRADSSPGAPAHLDWDATLRFRHHLWNLGLGVADAMDTAQRNAGLDWDTTAELVRRVGAEAVTRGAPLVFGVSTDHLPPEAVPSLEEVVAAYLLQLEVVETAGAGAVMMASRHLARAARTPEDYRRVYDDVIRQAGRPLILHWLGAAFDPQLEAYWGSRDRADNTEVVLGILADHAPRVAGIKLSLLDADHEIAVRRRLPPGVRMFCGDDFAYPTLVRGDRLGHSDALLGVFDAIAPLASAALARLDADDPQGFSEILDRTVPLARHLFETPTYHYKVGITFLAWLAGHQNGFVMVAGMAGSRGIPHLVEAFRLADGLGLFPDPELTARRMDAFLTVAGVHP